MPVFLTRDLGHGRHSGRHTEAQIHYVHFYLHLHKAVIVMYLKTTTNTDAHVPPPPKKSRALTLMHTPLTHTPKRRDASKEESISIRFQTLET